MWATSGFVAGRPVSFVCLLLPLNLERSLSCRPDRNRPPLGWTHSCWRGPDPDLETVSWGHRAGPAQMCRRFRLFVRATLGTVRWEVGVRHGAFHAVNRRESVCTRRRGGGG